MRLRVRMMKKLMWVFVSIFLISFVSAMSYPEGFNGDIIINGGGNVEGKTLVGYLDGTIAGSTIIHDKKFDIVITDETGSGGEIEFYIGSKKAKESFIFETFSVIKTNLTFTILVDDDLEYCGDSICDDWETCLNCLSDCGACPITPTAASGGGGGSSGGGSSSSSLNTTNQTSTESGDSSDLSGLSIDELNEKENEKRSSTNFLTGAATGMAVFFQSTLGIIALIVLSVLVIGTIIMIIIKKKVKA